MAIDYVGPAKIRLGGRPLVQVQSCRIERMSNNKMVKTLSGAFGKTNGQPEVSIDLAQAIPEIGRETDWPDLLFNSPTVEIDVEMASKVETFEGWFESVGTNSEVDTPSSDSAKFHGRRKASRSTST